MCCLHIENRDVTETIIEITIEITIEIIIETRKKKFYEQCVQERGTVVVAVLTLTRIIISVVTGQAPVTLELRNTLGKNTNKPKVVHAYIIADAIHASTRNI